MQQLEEENQKRPYVFVQGTFILFLLRNFYYTELDTRKKEIRGFWFVSSLLSSYTFGNSQEDEQQCNDFDNNSSSSHLLINADMMKQLRKRRRFWHAAAAAAVVVVIA